MNHLRAQWRTAASGQQMVRGFSLRLTRDQGESLALLINNGHLAQAGALVLSEATTDGVGVWWAPISERHQVLPFSGKGDLARDNSGKVTWPSDAHRIGVIVHGTPLTEPTFQNTRYAPGSKVAVTAVEVWVYDAPAKFMLISETGDWLTLPVNRTVTAAKQRRLGDLSESEFRSKKWLYHGTARDDDLEKLLSQGVRMSNVPMNLNRRRVLNGDYEGVFFQPGAGGGMGLYVTGDYYTASGYGKHTIAIDWQPGDKVILPPESSEPGYKFEWALKDNNGLLLASDVPASRVYLVESNRKTYGTDAWKSAQEYVGKTAALNGPKDVPPKPTKSPLPGGRVRGFHVTPGVNLESVRRGGLLMSRSKTHTYGEPTIIWFSNDLSYWSTGGDGDKIMVEVAIPPDWITQGGPTGNFAVSRDVTPEYFLAIHEDWHDAYRYFIEHRMVDEVLAGDYDYAMNMPRYKKAIDKIKREAR